MPKITTEIQLTNVKEPRRVREQSSCFATLSTLKCKAHDEAKLVIFGN